MTAGALLTVFATVLASEGDAVRIDKGLVDGLRPGDRGSLYYLLEVGGGTKRIDLGAVEVVAVDEHEATLGEAGERPARPGFLVAVELPAERLAPAQIVATAREVLGEEVARRLARGFLDALVAEDEELATARDGRPVETSAEPGTLARPRDSSPPRVDRGAAVPALDKVLVRGGRYWIGADLDDATFHNETPRFEVWIDSFEIDRLPTALPPTGISHAEAELACRSRGGRLPTELEWEVAVRSAGIVTGSPPLEWTSSWYQPYPGNGRPEKEYGETFRVVRGARADVGIGPRQRRFMLPGQGSPRIGFRCVRAPGP